MSKPLFDDTDLALCVVDALVAQRLLETSIRVPELVPRRSDFDRLPSSAQLG